VTKPCLPDDLVVEVAACWLRHDTRDSDEEIPAHGEGKESPPASAPRKTASARPAPRCRAACRTAAPATAARRCSSRSGRAAAQRRGGARRGDPRHARDRSARHETRVERVVERAPKPSLRRDRASAGRGRYVYCIIRASQPLQFGAIGMDEQWADVYTINYKDMAAVVSDVPIAPLDSTRENVLAHERVNETVMRDHTVIPMSFGTIFKTREDIVELLRSAYDAFADVLNKMQDKLEFGLKVLWDRDEIVKAIERGRGHPPPEVGDLLAEGSTYFRAHAVRPADRSARCSASERYVAEFLQRLRDVSVASRVNRAIGDKMIMNAAFLVQRDRRWQFDKRIKEIASHFGKLTFKYTGPWPPYNFVNIRLKLERAGQH
jgi:hypothetical protein